MKKLKSDNSITGLIPAIISLLVLALVSSLYGLQAGINTLGIIILSYSILFGLWSFIKTGNRYFLVSFAYMLAFGLFLLFLEPGMLKRYGGKLDTGAGFLFIIVLFLLLWLVFILITKKVKWRGREVLELAAEGVSEGEDSYTDRPHPAGKISGSRYEIIDFARYLRRNLIFMTAEEGDRIILVPVKMGQEFSILYRSNIDRVENTRITIDFEGNVLVHISSRDYLDYRDDLSFHHLCESLGNLVIGFYDQYISHEEVRIMDKVNSVKVGYFS